METKQKYITSSSNGDSVNVTITQMSRRAKAYSKVIRGFLDIASGLYELIFNEDPPKPRDAIRG